MKGTTAPLTRLIGRVTEGKRKLLSGEGVSPTLPLCLWAIAVSGAPAFLGVTPFGVALLCSAQGALIPLTLSLSFGAALRAEVLLIPIYVFLLCFRMITAMWLGEDPGRIRLLLCAAAMTVYGLFGVLTVGDATALLRAAVGTVAAAFLCLCALQAEDGEIEKKAAVLALVYATACAARGLVLYGIDLGIVLGFIICINLARYAGGTVGCAAGALWGLGCAPEYAPAFAVSALIGGRVASPVLGVGAGAVFCMLFAAFVGGYHGIRDFLPHVPVAAVLYPPLSRLKWMKWDFLAEDTPEEEDTAASEKEKRLSAMAGALGSLSAIFYGMSDRLKQREGYTPASDMTVAFAEDYSAMSELIRSALQEEDSQGDPILTGRIYGMLRMSRLRPSRVRATGGRVRRIVIEGLPKSVMADPHTLKRRVDNISGIEFSSPAFTVTDKGVRATLTAAPILRVRWSIADRAKAGETVNGDCATAFTAEDGRFYCILCDGMGSGRDAAVASRTCCVFLQKMLESGADPALSVRMLNTFLRGKGYECFATVDIFCIDLYTGGAFFIKGGSAPSHLFRSGCEYTMASATAPVGIIREVYAEKIAFDAQAGDCIVMKSDGADDHAPPKAPAAAEPDAAAKELLSAALARGQNDDVTVCVINIEGV